MTLHFIQLRLANNTYKSQVSTDGCSYVDDFKGAIKTKLPHLLAAYDAAQLTLLQPDGNTEIDPGESIKKLNEFNVGPWTPLVVTVDELPIPAPISSSKKQLIYKGMSTEASCRKFLDALARQLALYYDFRWGKDEEKQNDYPTFGDVLFAKRKKKWSFRYDEIGATDEEGFTSVKPQKIPKSNIPLPNLFSDDEWRKLDDLNDSTNERIHDADIPKRHGKSFVIVPENDYSQDTIDFIKSVAVKARLFTDEKKLDVKNESHLSGSSSSESSSPDKEKKM
jgi:hypothetical protein